MRSRLASALAFALAVAAIGTPATAAVLDSLSVKDAPYGARGDGVTDDSAAIQQAINDGVAQNRGTVTFPPGRYLCATPLTIPAGSQGLTLQGVGSATSGSGLSSALVYTGTGNGSFLIGGRTSGLNIRNLAIGYTSNDFRGTLLDLDCPLPNAETVFATIENCFVGSFGATTSSVTLIALSRASRIGIYRSNINGGSVGIRGRAASGQHSNVVRIVDSRLGALETAIKNAGEDWIISGNSFEPSRSGGAGGYDQDPGLCASNVNFFGNWFGDVTTTGTWIRFCGNNLTIVGNLIYGSATTTGIQIVGSGTSGISIHGNNFGWHGTGIDLGSGNNGFAVQANNFDSSVTNPIRGMSETSEAIVAGNNATVPSMIRIGGNITSAGTVRGASIVASDSVRGQTLAAAPGSGSIIAGGDASNVTHLIRPSAGKNGWLAFAEDGVAGRWATGIRAGDPNLYFATGDAGSGTPRVIFGPAGLGVGGKAPAVSLDADGAVAMRPTAMALAAGLNSNVALGNRSYVRITSPKAPFAIGGFSGGADGQILVIYNRGGGEMTLKNEDPFSTLESRMLTLTGGDVRLTGASTATLIYDAGDSRWILLSSNDGGRSATVTLTGR